MAAGVGSRVNDVVDALEGGPQGLTLDNVVMYSANHNGGATAYTPVQFSVPCGQHTLAISAVYPLRGTEGERSR